MQRNMKKFATKSEREMVNLVRGLELYAAGQGKQLTQELLNKLHEAMLVELQVNHAHLGALQAFLFRFLISDFVSLSNFVQCEFHSRNEEFEKKAATMAADATKDFEHIRLDPNEMNKLGVELGAVGKSKVTQQRSAPMDTDEAAAGGQNGDERGGKGSSSEEEEEQQQQADMDEEEQQQEEEEEGEEEEGEEEEGEEEPEFAELVARVNAHRANRKAKGKRLLPFKCLSDFDGQKMGKPELQEAVAALHSNDYTIAYGAGGKITGGTITTGLQLQDLRKLLSECLHSAAVMRFGTTLADAWKQVLPKAEGWVDDLPEPAAADMSGRSKEEEALMQKLAGLDSGRLKVASRVHQDGKRWDTQQVRSRHRHHLHCQSP